MNVVEAVLAGVRRSRAVVVDRERERERASCGPGALSLARVAAHSKLSPSEIKFLVDCGAIVLLPGCYLLPPALPVSELVWLPKKKTTRGARARLVAR